MEVADFPYDLLEGQRIKLKTETMGGNYEKGRKKEERKNGT